MNGKALAIDNDAAAIRYHFEAVIIWEIVAIPANIFNLDFCLQVLAHLSRQQLIVIRMNPLIAACNFIHPERRVLGHLNDLSGRKALKQEPEDMPVTPLYGIF